MRNFHEYMLGKSDEFKRVMDQAESYYEAGEKDPKNYQFAWQLAQTARPASDDDASYKTLFLAQLKEKMPEFLATMKKRPPTLP